MIVIWFSLPRPLFNDPFSTVLTGRNGALLGARLADDQQWRFPGRQGIPDKFSEAIIHYEDRWFWLHSGFNPIALVRAAAQNVRADRIISGGSTLTMQVIRLARKGRPRTLKEKAAELYLAWRLELTHSKKEILQLYAAHAPFGGNVVGLEAASWRYFGVSPRHLSWGAAATLAVLPNSPALIHPGRNRHLLLEKRNRLLDRLHQRGVIDASTCSLAKCEPIPGKPFPLPRLAPHLLSRSIPEGWKGSMMVSTIDEGLQARTAEILDNHRSFWNANGIWNAAVIVADVHTMQVLAIHGNIPNPDSREHGQEVDITRSPRSTGSILKPILYAAMLNEGLILPHTLIPDVPTQIGGFVPENYNLTYDGAVSASQALARSLNIPAVKMLQTYTYPQFYHLLKRLGVSTLKKPPGHYGLSVILGGAEATLWDMTSIYAVLAGKLNTASESPAPGRQTAWLTYIPDHIHRHPTLAGTSFPFDPGSLFLTFEAMVEVVRPGDEMMWRQFSAASRIAWKTGTSFGNRDAWAIGVTPEFVVGVWVGNASGEGRPGLTGITMAAPVLFDVFRSLPPTTWFKVPEHSLVRIPVCRHSGHRASDLCETTDTIGIPKAGLKTDPCPYHQIVHLDSTGRWQVTSDCASPSSMHHVAWFVLPPVQEWYFRNRNPFYKALPPFLPGCQPSGGRKNMELIYPRHNSVLYIPVELNGKPGSTVFRAAHRNPSAVVYWHLDDRFAGTTKQHHQLAFSPPRGPHRLSLTDQYGESITVRFEVISNKGKP